MLLCVVGGCTSSMYLEGKDYAVSKLGVTYGLDSRIECKLRLCFRGGKPVRCSVNDVSGSSRVPAQRPGKPLEIIGQDAELLSKLTTLERPSVPFPLLGNRHMETIFGAYFRSLPSTRFQREALHMADGGTMALDWPVAGNDVDLWNRELPDNALVVILLVSQVGVVILM
ncbi:hypothetical protein SUGI_1043530 [Cryptomeria japonica]|nr:hypothetical protein SUGI_1043530 [Cryptomeria japonica]